MTEANRQLRNAILRRVGAMSVWRKGDQRAPHKPLLFLLALSRTLRGDDRLVRFAEIEEPLTRLLQKYGPPRKNVHPHYPFWWLQTDELWEVPGGPLLKKCVGNQNPTRTALRAGGLGGFPPDVDHALRTDRVLARRAVGLLLNDHFPHSLHDELLADTGISVDALGNATGRDPSFRRDVVVAYEHRCAVCGFDIRVADGVDLALEAAHIKWRQAGGPDVVQNGVALCAVHHRAFDLGAIAVDAQCLVIVSGTVYGQSALSEWFLRFHRQPLRPPHSASLAPDDAFLAWHRREVFRSPPRE